MSQKGCDRDSWPETNLIPKCPIYFFPLRHFWLSRDLLTFRIPEMAHFSWRKRLGHFGVSSTNADHVLGTNRKMSQFQGKSGLFGLCITLTVSVTRDFMMPPPPNIRAERKWRYLNHKWPMYVKLKTFLRFCVGKNFRNFDHVIKKIDFCDQKFRDFRLVRFFHWVEFDSTFVLFWTVFSFQSNF